MSDIQQCQLCGADLVAGGSDINAELARLRVAYEQERQDCINLTEKVIPNLRAAIERLRGELADVTSKPFAYCTEPRSEILARQQAEIERLRGMLREALEGGYIRVPYGASHEDVSAILDFEKRIREAI